MDGVGQMRLHEIGNLEQMGQNGIDNFRQMGLHEIDNLGQMRQNGIDNMRYARQYKTGTCRQTRQFKIENVGRRDVCMSFTFSYVLFGGVEGSVASESALRSVGNLLSWVRATPPAPWSDGGPESLRSPCLDCDIQ
ncbi:hypothetical protein PoB_001766900 [Plakobranchus ocellatus]|uniref:Uncharacterized protein n=1 Tax=Plakobranchus ocellatus TaxID=259542 RepID=A0AAV3ZB37_9GAST|nr:hypothetical protein PoB_001766900 [Plakobranchus ocellatus]